MATTDLFRRAGADISPCGRWRLERRWDGRELAAEGTLLFVMLNPSTADAEQDDPTIRRCVRFAADGGAGALVVCNLFSFCVTDPDALLEAPDPVGPETDTVLVREAPGPDAPSWPSAAPTRASSRARHVAGMLTAQSVRLDALALTKEGWPRHPLYLPASARPVAWIPPAPVTPTFLA